MALLRKTKIINGSSMPPSAAIPTAEEICQRASVIAFGKALPAHKTIGLARLCSLSPAIGWCGLFDVIEAVRLRRGSHSPLSGAPRA
jgi:hypothetical protein